MTLIVNNSYGVTASIGPNPDASAINKFKNWSDKELLDEFAISYTYFKQEDLNMKEMYLSGEGINRVIHIPKKG